MHSIVKKIKKKDKDPETEKLYTFVTFKESINKYKDEVLWAEFCYLYWINNKENLVVNGTLKIGGLYDRKRKWIQNDKLLRDFEFGKLPT